MNNELIAKIYRQLGAIENRPTTNPGLARHRETAAGRKLFVVKSETSSDESSDESVDKFTALHRELHAEWRPKTVTESQLVGELALIQWAIRSLFYSDRETFRTQTVAIQIRARIIDTLLKLKARSDAKTARKSPTLGPAA
jgi:hypothetical protein